MSTENLRVESKARYDKKRMKTSVSFNMESPEEAAMYEYAKTKKFSLWAKAKLEEEMRSKGLL